MEAWLQQLMTASMTFTFVAIMSVAFLESLALVGLLLPGAVIMISIGTLIGNGQINFYPAWAAGVAGCLLGDWSSFFIGRAFKQPLHNWPFLQKNHILLHKIEHALSAHHMVTLLSGRFIGPARPLVPMVAGMLNLPLLKFALPDIIGCLAWPPIYFFPGILAGVAIEIPAHTQQFKWLLLLVMILTWLACWLLWRWWQEGKRNPDRFSHWLPPARLKWMSILTVTSTLASMVCLYQQPLMPVYRHLLWQIFMGQR